MLSSYRRVRHIAAVGPGHPPPLVWPGRPRRCNCGCGSILRVRHRPRARCRLRVRCPLSFAGQVPFCGPGAVLRARCALCTRRAVRDRPAFAGRARFAGPGRLRASCGLRVRCGLPVGLKNHRAPINKEPRIPKTTERAITLAWEDIAYQHIFGNRHILNPNAIGGPSSWTNDMVRMQGAHHFKHVFQLIKGFSRAKYRNTPAIPPSPSVNIEDLALKYPSMQICPTQVHLDMHMDSLLADFPSSSRYGHPVSSH